MTRVRDVLDYGMGNLRSVEKALEHVGAEVVRTSDPDGAPPMPTGWCFLGSARSPKAMERIRELELDRLIAEQADGRHPVLGICLGYQLLFESSTELGGADGLGLIEGPVDGLRRRGPEGAAHRLGAGRVDARVGADRGDRRRRRRSTSSTASRRVRRDDDDVLGTRRRTASASPARSRARRSTGSSFTPRSRAPPGLRLLAELRARSAPAVPARRDPLPGDRHPRRPRRPAGPGRLRPRDGVRRRSARRGADAGSSRAPGRCTSSTSTARGTGRRSTSSTSRGSARRSSVPVQVGGGLRQAGDVEAVLGAGAAARDPRHRGASPTRRWSRRWSPTTASAIVVVGRRPRAARSRSRAGSARRRSPPPT